MEIELSHDMYKEYHHKVQEYHEQMKQLYLY